MTKEHRREYAVQLRREADGALWATLPETEQATAEAAHHRLILERDRIGAGYAFRVVRRDVSAWEPVA